MHLDIYLCLDTQEKDYVYRKAKTKVI
jgi:hypothetical protein